MWLSPLRDVNGGEILGQVVSTLSDYVRLSVKGKGAWVPFACGVRRLKVPMTIGGDTPKGNGTNGTLSAIESEFDVVIPSSLS